MSLLSVSHRMRATSVPPIGPPGWAPPPAIPRTRRTNSLAPLVRASCGARKIHDIGPRPRPCPASGLWGRTKSRRHLQGIERLVQSRAKGAVAPIEAVGGHASEGQAQLHCSLNHGQGQLRLGLENSLGGEEQFLAHLGKQRTKPVLRQEQFVVHQRPGSAGGRGKAQASNYSPVLSLSCPPVSELLFVASLPLQIASQRSDSGFGEVLLVALLSPF